MTLRLAFAVRCLMASLFFVVAGSSLLAAPTGPTLYFDYGSGHAVTNPVVKFMYFVPLVSPELITVSTNAGNTQCARVLTYECKTTGKSFHVTCEFEFAGEGEQQNIFDNSPSVERHIQDLKAGKPLAHQIRVISVTGGGNGTLEIEGVITNGARLANEIRMRFNSQGHVSPVNIDLQDISWKDGAVCYDNEVVARVTTLTFHRDCTDPKMEVTLDSIKKKSAGDGFWSNFIGGVKGMAANMFLPPIRITPEGNRAMLDFGEALATQKPAFTFPYATRLTNGPVAAR